MKYVVKIDYKQFMFSDGDAAKDFAEMAMETAVAEDTCVEIELVKEVEA